MPVENRTWSFPLQHPGTVSLPIQRVLGKLPRKLQKKLKKQKYSMKIDIQRNDYCLDHEFLHSWHKVAAAP